MQNLAPRAGRRLNHPARAMSVLLAGIAAVVSPGVAAAQDSLATVETPAPQPPPDHWAAAAELTFTSASGNQEFTVLTTGFTLRHLQTERFGFKAQVEARYYNPGNEAEGEETSFQSYKGSFSFDFNSSGRWSPFVFASGENNAAKRIDLRANGGAGAKYRVYNDGEQGTAEVSVALLQSYESLDAPTVDSPTRQGRWDVKVNGRREIRAGVVLSHETEYQPNFDEPADYLLAMETGVKVLLNRHLALSVSHEFNHDATPAPGVRRDDSLLTAGLLVEL